MTRATLGATSPALDMIRWAATGAPALTERIAAHASWLDHPEFTAARWLGAWVWHWSTQPERAHRSPHVYIGLGHSQAIGVGWSDAPQPLYTLHTCETSLEYGVLNTHGALAGYSGLPIHVQILDPNA